eukprot:3361441-Amphidinium_carterae.2
MQTLRLATDMSADTLKSWNPNAVSIQISRGFCRPWNSTIPDPARPNLQWGYQMHQCKLKKLGPRTGLLPTYGTTNPKI